MDFHYKEIDESEVDPSLRGRARAMLEHCMKTLGLPAIRIQWIVKVEKTSFEFAEGLAAAERLLKSALHDYSDTKSPYRKWREEFWGRANALSPSGREKILVRADIPERGILETIAHECHHVYGNIKSWSYWEPWEKLAEDFSRKAMAKFDVR